MPTSRDVGQLRDALQALEVLNRLEALGQAPVASDGLRSQLDEIFRTFTKTLSGTSWCSKFPDHATIADLEDNFETAVTSFKKAMTDAGASIRVSSTLRPKERAYLMHYCWRISKGEVEAKDVPEMEGVDIEWVHPTDAASLQAAKDMVQRYGIMKKPSLTTRHTEGRAIDMTIGWAGDLKIKKADGTEKKITTTPRDGENTDLVAVGRTYGVIKASFEGDPPHWSDDGH